MVARIVRVLVGLLLVCGIGVRGAGPPVASAEDLAAPLSSTEQRIVDLVNLERGKVGLQPLNASAPLVASARSYASYMAAANFFSHVGPDGSTLDTRDEAAGYGAFTIIGENLAAGQATPDSAMAGWMASTEHRANILSPDMKEIGVGHARGGSYGNYWVQEFGGRPLAFRDAAMSPTSPRAGGEASWTAPGTGRTVSGEWLAFLKANSGVDNFGYPRTEVIADPLMGGQTVQYLQRAVFEYHPENDRDGTVPGTNIPLRNYRVQLALLGDEYIARNSLPFR